MNFQELDSEDAGWFVRNRRAILLLALVAAVAAAAYTFGPSAYRSAKRWRAVQHAEKGNALLAAGDPYRALIELRRAHLLAPTDARVIRAVAEFHAAQDKPQALQFLSALVESPAGEPADRMRLAELALRWGNLTLAAEQLKALRASPGSESEAIRADLLRTELAASRSGLPGARVRARETLTRAEARGLHADAARLLYARILLLAPAADSVASDRAEALRLLDQVGFGNRERPGLDALHLLARAANPADDTAEAGRVADAMDRHPLATARDRIAAAELRIRAAPEHRAGEMDRLEEAFRGGPDADRLALARWLIRMRETERVLKMVPRELADTSDDWCLVRLDALAGLGRWAEVKAELTGTTRLLPQVRLLFLARCARELGNRAEAQSIWIDLQRDLRIADARTSLYIAQYAERLGERDEAAAAYRRLIRSPETAETALEGFIRCTEPTGPAAPARAAIEDFLSARPDRAEARADYAYLSLLIGERIAEAERTAAALMQQDSTKLAYRTLAALAALRQGDPRKADTFYPPGIAWDQAPAGWKAVRAAVLQANNREGEAQVLLKGIAPENLRPEERALIGW